jgi:hypothetical protein
METARVLALIGGLLVLFGLLLGLAFILTATEGNLGLLPSFLGGLVALGFLIDLACGLVLVLSDDALLLLIAGIFGTISSFLLVGGVVGGIGGILGIVGSALMSGEATGGTARSEFLRARASAPSSSLEQHLIRCPNCGYLNRADSTFCGKCRNPLRTEENQS